MKLQRLLVYINAEDESLAALSQAAALARQAGAHLHLVDVVPETPWTVLGADQSQALAASIMAERRGALEELSTTLKREGLSVSSDVLVGRPFMRLIQEAVRGRYDAILKTAQGTGKLPWGSVAQHLIRKSPVPVWVVRATDSAPPKRIAVALDIFDADLGPGMAPPVLEVARALARAVSADLHIVHAIIIFAEGALARRQSPQFVAQVRRNYQSNAERRIAELLAASGLTLPAERLSVAFGPPELVIEHFVDSNACDLLVIGSVGRTGIPGYFIGNTAERVLARVSCAVLTVKPPKFVSPVSLEEDRS